LKILFDFLLIAIFFLSYQFYELITAVKVTILASMIQLISLRVLLGKFDKMSLLSFFSFLVLGGATLIFQNEIYIKWKPTIVYWSLALAFLVSQVVGKKMLIQYAANGLELENKVWRKLNFSWATFFIVMGTVNLFIAYNFNTQLWVKFKLFGTLAMTLIFIIIQSVLLAKFTDNRSFNDGN